MNLIPRSAKKRKGSLTSFVPRAGAWVMQVAISRAHLANKEREAGNTEGLHGYSGSAGCAVQLKSGATSEGC